MRNISYSFVKALAVFIMTVMAIGVSAQSDRQYIRNGNRLYRQQNFPKAEAEYRKALTQNHTNVQAAYNLGCALMQQQKDSAAIVQFENAGKAETSKLRKSMCYHNIGVICQKHRMFAEAIEAYKESLRNNPSDNETRYNLELCRRQLKNQQKDGGGNNNKEKEDKNKDQQKQQSEKQDKNKNDDKQKQQQNQQQKMSKENAEQMLNAAMQEEKATQQKLKSKMQQQQSRKLQNNW